MLENILLSIIRSIYSWLTSLVAPTSIIGFIVGFIAIQQYILAKNKFNFDRYEKRYQLYEITREFFDLTCNILGYSSDFDYEEVDRAHLKLKSRMSDALFLLNREAYEYIRQVEALGYSYLVEHKSIKRYMDRRKGTSVNTSEFVERLQKHGKTRMFVFNARESLVITFAKYLVIEDRNILTNYQVRLQFHYQKIAYVIMIKANEICMRIFLQEIFPISVDFKRIFLLLLLVFIICLWIIVG